tara:strand:- start:239 stop:472 length:234 start_codon:yes stop_codon:yes gene_type:complete
MPGVSKNNIWHFEVFSTPKILFLVVFGFSETAEIFLPVKALIRVDLPVLGLPNIEIVPDFILFILSNHYTFLVMFNK